MLLAISYFYLFYQVQAAVNQLPPAAHPATSASADHIAAAIQLSSTIIPFYFLSLFIQLPFLSSSPGARPSRLAIQARCQALALPLPLRLLLFRVVVRPFAFRSTARPVTGTDRPPAHPPFHHHHRPSPAHRHHRRHHRHHHFRHPSTDHSTGHYPLLALLRSTDRSDHPPILTGSTDPYHRTTPVRAPFAPPAGCCCCCRLLAGCFFCRCCCPDSLLLLPFYPNAFIYRQAPPPGAVRRRLSAPGAAAADRSPGRRHQQALLPAWLPLAVQFRQAARPGPGRPGQPGPSSDARPVRSPVVVVAPGRRRPSGRLPCPCPFRGAAQARPIARAKQHLAAGQPGQPPASRRRRQTPDRLSAGQRRRRFFFFAPAVPLPFFDQRIFLPPSFPGAGCQAPSRLRRRAGFAVRPSSPFCAAVLPFAAVCLLLSLSGSGQASSGSGLAFRSGQAGRQARPGQCQDRAVSRALVRTRQGLCLVRSLQGQAHQVCRPRAGARPGVGPGQPGLVVRPGPGQARLQVGSGRRQGQVRARPGPSGFGRVGSLPDIARLRYRPAARPCRRRAQAFVN